MHRVFVEFFYKLSVCFRTALKEPTPIRPEKKPLRGYVSNPPESVFISAKRPDGTFFPRLAKNCKQ